MTESQLVGALTAMVAHRHVHNINFVTPDHFFPHVFSVARRLRQQGIHIPLVYNLSGYQSTDLLRVAESHADIYLPDFKYADPSLAQRLSRCRDYPAVALSALEEMIRQKGFLDACIQDLETAAKGVLVRHLILPGYVRNSEDALSMLYVEFGKDLPVSLMSQYHPVCRHQDSNLNRFLHHDEFQTVYEHALELGFHHLYVQFPEQSHGTPSHPSIFLPDFRRADPFQHP
jgi:putative pyruvate formate lyase activating enzyme